MAYYDALIAQWATLPDGSITDKLAVLNSTLVAGPNLDVPISQVVSYLALAGKLAGLLAYAANPPTGSNPVAVVAAKELCALIQSPNSGPFRMSRPDVHAGITAFLAAMVADANTGLTSTDQTNILALSQTQVPWWKANGYPGAINQYDLQAAGVLS